MHAQAFPDIRQNNGRIVMVRNRVQFVIHLQILLMINSGIKIFLPLLSHYNLKMNKYNYIKNTSSPNFPSTPREPTKPLSPCKAKD